MSMNSQAITSDDKQYKAFLRVIDEEFGLLPTLTDVKVGSWAQFIEAKHRRVVIGQPCRLDVDARCEDVQTRTAIREIRFHVGNRRCAHRDRGRFARR